MEKHHDNRVRRDLALDEATSILERTPATLDALLRDLPSPWLRAHEGGDTWSAFDILGHLIHGEKTDWMIRTRIILQHGARQPFEPFDRFAQFEASRGRTVEELLDEFARLRHANLAALAALNLTPADLERTGRHPDLGSVTLSQLLAAWVAHDLDHVVQICRVLARQYTDAVGPWRAYLRIVRDD